MTPSLETLYCQRLGFTEPTPEHIERARPMLRAIAAHEAGHALVAMACGVVVRLVELLPDDVPQLHGRVSYRYGTVSHYSTIAHALAGPIAEALDQGEDYIEWDEEDPDYFSALESARLVYSSPAHVSRGLQRMEDRVRAYLRSRWDIVTALRDCLLSARIVAGEDVRRHYFRRRPQTPILPRRWAHQHRLLQYP